MTPTYRHPAPMIGPVCEAADWLALCDHPGNGESSCYTIQEDQGV